jgi:small-conductance mechanosensitive channel
LSDTNDLVIVPNSALAKARLTNLTGNDAIHGAEISIRVIPTRAPAVKSFHPFKRVAGGTSG